MLSLRTATAADAAALAAIYRPYVEQTDVTFELTAPDAAEFCRRMEKTLLRHPYLVAEEDGVILGYAYASPLIDRRAADAAAELCRTLGRRTEGCPDLDRYVVTCDEEFELNFGRKATKRRKIYNGMIKSCLYMYFDEKRNIRKREITRENKSK